MKSPRPTPASPTPADPFALPPLAGALLIFGAALLAYAPALTGGFLWDDGGHVTRADLRGFTGLIRIWTDFGATQQYYPLLHSAFWLEHHLWGDSTVGYHVLNVLQHATAACLFAAVLRRLAVPGSIFAALLFALHPVCVESVAWISEQKNTLSAVFYLAAMLCYLRYDRDRRTADYAWASGLFLAALLTKTVTATLPAALLVIFWWQRERRLDLRRDVLPLVPWLVVGVLGGWLTASFERGLIGATGDDFSLSLLERGLLSGRVLWFYLGKLAWPADLMFIYPRWMIDASSLAQWLFPIAALGLVGAGVWWTRRSRGPLAALLIFGGTLFPALGFFNVYPFLFSYVADHFQYLASLAIFALLAAALSRAPLIAARIGAIVVLVVLAGLTRAQSATYRDAATLYQITLAANPDCWMAHNNLGNLLVDQGQPVDAIPHFEAVLKLRPKFADAESNLGDALRRLGRNDESLAHLQRAVALAPNNPSAHNNLGATFMALNRLPEGIVEFHRALRLDPSSAQFHLNLGLGLANAGDTAGARTEFEAALKLQPDFPQAESNLGIALLLTNQLSTALPHFARAIELDPNYGEGHYFYGRALVTTGRLNEAIGEFGAALELQPNFADAHLQLALALRQTGRMPEASQHYAEAVRLNPSLGGKP